VVTSSRRDGRARGGFADALLAAVAASVGAAAPPGATAAG